MLQRLLYDDDLCDGLWPRDQLLEMDRRFTAAVARALELGHESWSAARATYAVKSPLNGSRLLAEEAAIGAAWRWFVDAKFDAPAAAVLARVRASCSNVAVERVREEFKKRLKGRW